MNSCRAARNFSIWKTEEKTKRGKLENKTFILFLIIFLPFETVKTHVLNRNQFPSLFLSNQTKRELKQDDYLHSCYRDMKHLENENQNTRSKIWRNKFRQQSRNSQKPSDIEQNFLRSNIGYLSQ